MIILGIHDGHDAGASLIKDGKIIAAINEERLNRTKLYLGIPQQAIDKVLQIANIEKNKIDAIALSGTSGLMANIGWENISFKKKIYQNLANYTPFPASMHFANLQRKIFNNFRDKKSLHYVKSLGFDCELKYFDHHKCHAATAYYTSGKNECLVFTSDGSGDGLSASVYHCKDGVMNLIKEIPTFHSLGYFYAYVTMIFGFKMFKHEGKVTGLFGDPNKCYSVFEKCFTFENGALKNNLGLIGRNAFEYLQRELKNFSREDIAAAVQKRLEDVMTKFVAYYVNKLKINDVALAGGVFANVKLNQKILELPEVNSVFIYPNMGDGGLASGAAFNYYSLKKTLLPYRLENVYFGPEYSNDEIAQSMKIEGVKGEYIKDPEKYAAELLANKKVVGHFDGRMEYGPRALGNRSIIADPTDKSINDWLNKRMRRSEFMPFAPSILKERAHEFFENFDKGNYPAEFMTITFNCKDIIKKAEAVVHVDNTARPQAVTKESNPRYYNILKHYEKLTGLPIVVNTSFNMHEEPIVCNPVDAIKSLKQGCVDYLIMGNWLVKNEK